MPGIEDGMPIVPSAKGRNNSLHCVSNSVPAVAPIINKDLEKNLRQAFSDLKKDVESGKKEAALNVLVYCHSLVSCQLNHFQYLFLMRQLDMLTEMSTFLTCDTKAIYETIEVAWAHDIEDSLVMSAIVPQVDVSFVVPPLHPSKDSMLCDTEGFVPDSSSTVGEVQEIDSLKEMRSSNSDFNVSQKLASNPTPECVPNNRSASYNIAKSSSDGLLSNSSSSSLNIGTSSVQTVSDEVPSDNYNSKSCRLSSEQFKSNLPLPAVNLPSPSSNSSHPIATHSGTPSSQNNLNIGLMSVKKGFSSLMTSLESSVKTRSPEDISDAISVQSDVSSDSENFMLVNFDSSVLGEKIDSGYGLESSFKADSSQVADQFGIEVASEAFEETTPSEEISEITNSFKRKSNVRIFTYCSVPWLL